MLILLPKRHGPSLHVLVSPHRNQLLFQPEQEWAVQAAVRKTRKLEKGSSTILCLLFLNPAPTVTKQCPENTFAPSVGELLIQCDQSSLLESFLPVFRIFFLLFCNISWFAKAQIWGKKWMQKKSSSKYFSNISRIYFILGFKKKKKKGRGEILSWVLTDG